MITSAIIQFFAGIAHVLLGLIPSLPVPSWLSGSDSAFSSVLQFAGSMSVWFPTTLVLTVSAFLLSAWGIGYAIKLARIVVSLFTAGGGSAA